VLVGNIFVVRILKGREHIDVSIPWLCCNASLAREQEARSRAVWRQRRNVAAQRVEET